MSLFSALNTPSEEIIQKAVEARKTLSELGKAIQSLKYQSPQSFNSLYKKYLALNAKQFEIEYGLRKLGKAFSGLGDFGEALSSGFIGFGAGFLNSHIRDIQETMNYATCLQNELRMGKDEQKARSSCAYHPASSTDWISEIGKILAPIIIVTITIIAGRKIWSAIQKNRR